MAPNERLDALVQGLDRDDKGDALGFFYLFWGIMNTLGVWIFTLVWYSVAFWVVWIPCGVVIMMALLQGKVRREGRILIKGMTLPRIWVALLGALPLLIWVFPDVLHLYGYQWIFPLTTAWVALGIFATGAQARRPTIAWGTLGFGAAAVLFPFFPESGSWIFTGANVFGLILPGAVSLYEERR